MVKLKRFGIGGLLLISAVYFLVFSAVRYNLAQTSAELASQPPTIVVDAGHGGVDGGTTGKAGTSESQLNLTIAKKTEQMLAFCGFRTLMIRDSDISVYTGDCQTISQKKVSDLKNRVRIINELPSAILISIHQNHFSDESYSGAQAFYGPAEGGKTLAGYLQSALREGVDPHNRRASKRASSVYLMEKIDCPGVLLECGFLSNPQEENRLNQPEYQKKIACAISVALAQYLQAGERNIEV